MARSKTRRGGAWYDPRSWFKPSCEKATKTSTEADEAAAKAKSTKDEVCAGESSAAEVPTETPVTAPPMGASRRPRRSTRRKYKGGRHRKGHRA